ncbi:ankyrin repeat protein [Grosmannia clavigera kw1407]|uniref:Ankyrin repeat protein n=1 Tax=Grosmannia clavigera (strain kw1407 / UAMH 11150) TaxID=655863 RepID=F0X737_GROCL|nr:ankyrin repeat protein [Grosmannia clavigera kw1407]EFX06707.1 ankyrin repeat protein [Grosmannia clavigera kw1407]
MAAIASSSSDKQVPVIVQTEVFDNKKDSVSPNDKPGNATTGQPSKAPSKMTSVKLADWKARLESLIEKPLENESRAEIKKLLSQDVQVKGNENLETAFYKILSAVLGKDKDNDGVVKLLIDSKHFKGSYRWGDDQCTALHRAVRNGRDEVTRKLVKEYRNTINIAIAKQLLENGAEINTKDVDGDSPLHDAVKNSYHEVIEVLIDYGADTEYRDFANKMSWVTDLVWCLTRDDDDPSFGKRKDAWDFLTRNIAQRKGVSHGSYMRVPHDSDKAEDSNIPKNSEATNLHRRELWRNGSKLSDEEKISIVVPYIDFETKHYLDRDSMQTPRFVDKRQLEETSFEYSGLSGLYQTQTLDQSYYDMLDKEELKIRDQDQVVMRWFSDLNHAAVENTMESKDGTSSLYENETRDDDSVNEPGDSTEKDSPVTNVVEKLLMVNQLWLWKLDKDRYHQGFESTLFETIRQGDIRSYKKPEELIENILFKCVTFLEEFWNAGLGIHLLDIFEISLAKKLDYFVALKQAQSALDEAMTAGRLNRYIMLFTLVTIVFTPLSFLTSLFAIPFDYFPRDDAGVRLSPGWTAKWMVAWIFSSSIPKVPSAAGTLVTTNPVVCGKVRMLRLAHSGALSRDGEDDGEDVFELSEEHTAASPSVDSAGMSHVHPAACWYQMRMREMVAACTMMRWTGLCAWAREKLVKSLDGLAIEMKYLVQLCRHRGHIGLRGVEIRRRADKVRKDFIGLTGATVGCARHLFRLPAHQNISCRGIRGGQHMHADIHDAELRPLLAKEIETEIRLITTQWKGQARPQIWLICLE